MAKRTKRAKAHGSTHENSRAASPRSPDWPLIAVAIAGLIVTSVLLWAMRPSNALPYCAAGTGCDIVQSSAWSYFLGLPLSLWGFAAYLGLGAAAAFPPGLRRRRWCALIGVAGFVISVYLTLVSGFVIGAYCTYCLASLALMSAALLLTFRPAARVDTSRARLTGLAAAVVVAGLMHGSALGLFSENSKVDPGMRALAEHLAVRGMKFYGASWCPHCQEQKALFGGAAKFLPYIECAPHGPKAPRATECELREIRNYPTWTIDDRRIERVLSLDSLAKISAFQPPGAASSEE